MRQIILTESQYKFIMNAQKGLIFEQYEERDNLFEGAAKTVCINPDKLYKDLNFIQSGGKLQKGETFIHNKSSLIPKDLADLNPEEQKAALEQFKKNITTEPLTVIGKNSKMVKSGSKNERVFNTGIPAVSGIVWKESEEKFKRVFTCPGMGSCLNVCYALSGNYIRFPNVYDSMIRRLNLLENDKERYKQRLVQELYNEARKFKAIKKHPDDVVTNSIVMRWNDSGDFYSDDYLWVAQTTMRELREMGVVIRSTSYSKIADVAYDTNWEKGKDFRSASTGSNKREAQKFGKYAEEFPNEVKDADIGYGDKYGFNRNFSNFDRTNPDDREKLRIAVSEVHNYPEETVIFYDELMDIKDNEVPFWNVIVITKKQKGIAADGDRASWRGDVKSINNLLH